MTDQERRKPDTVVTSETLAAWQAQKLEVEEAPPPKIEEKKEEVVVAETPKEEASEIAEIEENSEKTGKAKQKLSERMHELAEKAKTERARREEIERELAEVKAKLPTPVPIIEDTQKPSRDQFTDAFEYAEKLAEWSTKKALKDRDVAEAKSRQDAEQSRVIDDWNGRLNAIKKEIPDFADRISASEVKVSDEIKRAIMESDVGPQILLHLADNPEEAEKIAKMTVGKAHIAFGRLEAKLSATEVVTEKEERQPEISKAPPPISPLKGAKSTVDSAVEFTQNNSNIYASKPGSYEKYKEARRTGKIK